LNISKFNEGRHNWQRLDTFHTPWGKSGPPQEATASPASRVAEPVVAALPTDGSRSPGNLVVVVEGLNQLREDLVQAVNCIVAELRSDIKAESAAQRQASSRLLEEIRLVRSELPANLGPPPPPDMEPVLTAVRETAREQVEAAIRAASASAAAAVRAELAKAPPMEEQLAPLLRGRPSEPSCLKDMHSLSFQGNFEERLAELSEMLREVRGASERLDRATQRLDQSALLRAIEQAKVEVKAACDVEPHLSHILHELKTLRTSVDQSPVLEAVRACGKSCETTGTRMLSALREVQTDLAGLDLQRLNARDRAREELGAVLAEVREELLKREADRASVLQAIRERDASIDLSEVLREIQRLRAALDHDPVLREIERLRTGLDFTPVLRAIEERRLDVDLSGVVREIREKRFDVDFTGVLRELRELREQRRDVDVSPLLAELRDLRSDLDLPSVLREVHRIKSEVDFSAVFAELRRKDEAVEASIARALARSPRQAVLESDLAPIVRAVQDALAIAAASQERRADDDAQRLLREFRSQRVEADSALVAAVRGCVPKLDLSPVLQELRGVRSDIDQVLARGSLAPRAEVTRQERVWDFGHELSSILQELRGAVKSEVDNAFTRGGISLEITRQEPAVDFKHELSLILQAIQDKELRVDLGPVMQELRRMRNELDPNAALRTAREGTLEQVLHEIRRSGLEQLTALKAVRPECGLAAVLDAVRQTVTKAEFNLGIEEIRGHFSGTLKAIAQAGANGPGPVAWPEMEALVAKAVAAQAESMRPLSAGAMYTRSCAACGQLCCATCGRGCAASCACGHQGGLAEVLSRLWELQRTVANLCPITMHHPDSAGRLPQH